MLTSDLVVAWAEARNLISGSDSKSQMLKCMEEVGELAKAINKDDQYEIMDGIGDVAVTLIVIAEQNGYNFEDCLTWAYDQIKDRKGKMVSGIFVKEA